MILKFFSSIPFVFILLALSTEALPILQGQQYPHYKESRVNVDHVDGNTEVDPARLNLFPEQFKGQTLYYSCVQFEGFEKNSDVLSLRITKLGTFFPPILRRDGITFITSSNLASQALNHSIRRTENCQLELGFRVEQLGDYWIARVFEIGIYYSAVRIENVLSDDPDTSIVAAGKRGDAYSVEAILKWSKNVNAIDKYGKTALMYAAENGHSKTAKTLLERGADPNAKSKAGMTALAYARQASKKDTIKILERSGASE